MKAGTTEAKFMKTKKTKWIVLIGALALTGCAGGNRMRQADLQQNLAEQLDDWSVRRKSALIEHASAKTPAEITQAIDKLVASAETAPIQEAQDAAVKDACLAASAAGDAAVLTRFKCEEGALKKLIGGY